VTFSSLIQPQAERSKKHRTGKLEHTSQDIIKPYRIFSYIAFGYSSNILLFSHRLSVQKNNIGRGLKAMSTRLFEAFTKI
jgi:hypothetical protein